MIIEFCLGNTISPDKPRSPRKPFSILAMLRRQESPERSLWCLVGYMLGTVKVRMQLPPTVVLLWPNLRHFQPFPFYIFFFLQSLLLCYFMFECRQPFHAIKIKTLNKRFIINNFSPRSKYKSKKIARTYFRVLNLFLIFWIS